MLVRTLECDVCKTAAKHRAVSNIVSTERGDAGIPTGDWFVVTLHELAGAERGLAALCEEYGAATILTVLAEGEEEDT